MNKTEYNKYSKQATNALKEGKRKYDEIINFITDELLKPFGYNNKSRIVYKNKNYKIHKATLNEDGEIIFMYKFFTLLQIMLKELCKA